jgi:hypothetical protein
LLTPAPTALESAPFSESSTARMLTMTRWWAALAAAIFSAVLTGCSDRSVNIDETDELTNLRDVHVTLATEVFHVGREEARIGVASGVHFAVVVGDETLRRVTINGRSYRLVVACAGAGFYAEAERFSGVVFKVADAAYDKLAPDAYCEG